MNIIDRLRKQISELKTDGFWVIRIDAGSEIIKQINREASDKLGEVVELKQIAGIPISEPDGYGILRLEIILSISLTNNLK